MTTSADLCRANGWGPGTALVGDEGAVVVTAVGERSVLARLVATKGEAGWARNPCGEAAWDLTRGRWREAPAGEWRELRAMAG